MKKQISKVSVSKIFALLVFISISLNGLLGAVGQMVSGNPLVTVNHLNFQSQIQTDLGANGYTNISLVSMVIDYTDSLPVFKYIVTCVSLTGENRKLNVSVPLIYNSTANEFDVDNLQIQNGGRKTLTCVGTNCADNGCAINDNNDGCTECNPRTGETGASCTKTESNSSGGGSLEPWLSALVGLIGAWVTWLGH